MRCITVAVFLIAGSASFAQEARHPESPEEFYSRITKLALSDAEQFVAAHHPDELRRFRGLILTTWRKIPNDQKHTVFSVLFDGISNIDELRAMTDSEIYASFWRQLMNSQTPDQIALMKSVVVRPLGHVMEGGNKAHVVVRATVPGTDYSALDVVTLKRHEGNWYGTMKEEMVARMNAITDKLVSDLNEIPIQ